MEKKGFILAGWAAMAIIGFGAMAQANTTVFDQGFESDFDGWLDGTNGWDGTITRVPSNSAGIPAASGGYYAQFEQGGDAGNETGPFGRFGTYRTSFGDGFIASAAIYLNTEWTSGEGFDYSVAANSISNGHVRDFIFHVTKDTSTGKLLIGADNNSNSNPIENLETRANYYEVTDSGWYTFEHVFRDAGDGTLAVDLNLYALGGTTALFTETRNNSADVIGTLVGGNRYGWFTNIDISGGVAVDSTSLTLVPEPGTLSLLGIGAAAMLRRRRA